MCIKIHEKHREGATQAVRNRENILSIHVTMRHDFIEKQQ